LRRATAVVLGTITGAGLLVGAKVGNAPFAASGAATATAVSGRDGTTVIPPPGGSAGGSSPAVAPSTGGHASAKPSASARPTASSTRSTSKPTVTPKPTPTATGPRDGTYKASSSERYGTLTLTVSISGHRITDITAAYESRTPEYCTTKACPKLRSEALTAQSANIATVSGATYTSDAYKAALAAVLKSAG
jgi:uncharacterized protein with FMN-binding domain